MLQSIKTVIERQMHTLFQFGDRALPFPVRSGIFRQQGILCVTETKLRQSYQTLHQGGDCSRSSAATVSLALNNPTSTETQNTVAPTPENFDGLKAFFSSIKLEPSTSLKFPAVNPLTCQTINWAEEIRQETLTGLQKNADREAKLQALSSNAQINRLTHLMRMALCSGNINLAMMIFSHLEARAANEVTRGLMNKVQALQDRKRQLSQEIQNQKDDAQGSKNIQKFKADMDQASDDIGVLQTFIREIAQNKQQSIEMANAFISKEHESAMSTLRSWSR